MRVGRIQIPLYAGHHRPASETPFNADDGSKWNAGLVVLLYSGDPDQYDQETLIFCDFSGGWSGTPANQPPLDPRMNSEFI